MHTISGGEMRLPTIVRLVIWGIFLSIIFVLNECKKLDGYKFPVYSTPFCPRNESEWNKRSSALNCNRTNGYTCLPNEKLTELLEFCYIEPWIWIEEGLCLYLEKKGSYVDSFNCRHFIHGCHNTSYQSRRIFEYQACISIGNGCFLAEESCKSSPNTTHRPKTTENNQDDLFWVVIVIGIVVVFVCASFCMLYFYRKKRKFHKNRRGIDIEGNGELEEENSLIANTENENLDCSDKESPFDLAIFEHWGQENEWFISSNACIAVENKTASKNIVIVTGYSGSGKSAIIQHVALKYRKKGWIVKPVKDIEDIANTPFVRNNITNILFVFNDPFGKESLDELLYNKWERYEEALPSYLKRAKLLMSCRKIILSDKKVKGLFRDVSNVVDINSDQYKLNEEEKRSILKSYKIDEKLSEDECAEIVKIEEYFPLLCKLYSRNNESNLMEGLFFFKEPDVVLAEEIRGLRNTSKEKYCALILLILFNNDLRIDDIPGNKAVQEKYEHALNLCGMDTKTAAYLIRDELESLKGFLVKKIKDTYQFYHDFVMEVTTLIVGTDYPQTVIKYADIGFLRTRVRYDTGNETPDKFTIYLSDRHIDALGDRLFSDIFGERLLDVVLNPCLQYESVKMVFEKKLKNNSEKLQMLLKKIELQTDKQKLHQTTTNLHLSKLTFVHLENEVSCLFVLIVFGHTDLSLHCLKALKETQVNLTGISLFSAVCCNGSVELFYWFLKNNNECLTEKWEGLSPIHVVTVFHNSEILKQLIEKTTINVNLMIDKTNEPNPSLISTEKDKEINTNHTKGNSSKTQNNKRKVLKSTKEDISLCLKYQTSSIHIACFDGCNSIVQILLSNGANVNLCDEKGKSPFFRACQNGHDSIVQLLLSNGADINLCEEEGASPLYIASQNGHDSTVQLLLSNGADINLCMEEGASPLYIASQNGHDSTVQLLLSNGADINLCMEDGTSPLTGACFDGHESTVQLLLSNGADINLCKKNGAGPLDIACQNGHDSTVQLLLSNGADINVCKTNGAGPLYIACQNGHDSTVQLLLSNGANINLCMEEGASPLYIASQKGHDSTVQLLLSNGADINLCMEDGTSPLTGACFDGHESTVQLLLSNGADINLCKKNGAGPLDIACQNGHDSTVQLLLSNGADINLCEEEGES
nr:uncharacterized protein LOC105341815 [Crassostrea gigas]